MKNKPDIYVIFEGPTEQKILEFLKKNLEAKYNILLINAKGKDNIIKKYLNKKRINRYNDVIVMYDLDDVDTLDSIYKMYDSKEITIDKKDIFFINPCVEIMFIFFKEYRVPSKNKLGLSIKRLYGVENYEKSDKQLNQIIKQIDLTELPHLIKKLSSFKETNYDKLLNKIFKVKL